jgi:hypothetical protein
MVYAMLTKLKAHGRSLGYSENLLAPIVVPSADTRTLILALSGKDKSSNPSAVDWYRTERLRKLERLASHYNLEAAVEKCALDLALRIATDWVPGFSQVATKPRGKGAPTKNSVDSNADLFGRVTMLMQSKGLSLRKACERFKKEAATKSRWKAVSPQHLENAYRDIKKQSIESSERVEAYRRQLDEQKRMAVKVKPRSVGIHMGMRPQSKKAT